MDYVPKVMLEMEVELHLLLTSVFDRLIRSESNDVATVFEMHKRIQRDCAKIYTHTMHSVVSFRIHLTM
jgi:hypothetical protein